MTRRQRHRSELLHIIISLLNHKLRATSAAAQAAYECLHLHPFLPWLPIRMVVLVWFLRRTKKKKRGRKREFSFYCSCKTCPEQSVIRTGRFNCIISSFFYFTDLLFHLQIIYRYTITFIYFQLWLNRINVCTALKKCL